MLAQSTAAPAILAPGGPDERLRLVQRRRRGRPPEGRTTVIDSIGQVGNDPGTEWGTGLTSTADNTLRRKASIEAGDGLATDAFDPATEWLGFATDTFDGLGCAGESACTIGDTAPSVSATSPLAGATSVARDANVSITFSEPVTVAGGWYTITCTTSGIHAATAVR